MKLPFRSGEEYPEVTINEEIMLTINNCSPFMRPGRPNTSSFPKDLRENNLDNLAPRFGSDLDGTIEKNPRHSTAMLRVFRLRPVQRWLEDGMRDVQVIFSQVLKKRKKLGWAHENWKRLFHSVWRFTTKTNDVSIHIQDLDAIP